MQVATAAPYATCFFFWRGLVMFKFLGPSRQRLWVRCSAQGSCLDQLQAPRELSGQKKMIWLNEQFGNYYSGNCYLFVPCFLTITSFYLFGSHPTSKTHHFLYASCCCAWWRHVVTLTLMVVYKSAIKNLSTMGEFKHLTKILHIKSSEKHPSSLVSSPYPIAQVSNHHIRS